MTRPVKRWVLSKGTVSDQSADVTDRTLDSMDNRESMIFLSSIIDHAEGTPKKVPSG